jgi:hypothetical protein
MTEKVRRWRIVPCACGGTIRGEIANPAKYVLAHNRSMLHRNWRAIQEFDDRYLAEIAREKLPA